DTAFSACSSQSLGQSSRGSVGRSEVALNRIAIARNGQHGSIACEFLPRASCSFQPQNACFSLSRSFPSRMVLPRSVRVTSVCCSVPSIWIGPHVKASSDSVCLGHLHMSDGDLRSSQGS